MAKKKNGPAFKTMCGGQALIEGIMMRGPEKEAVVIRKPNGELEVKVEPLKLVKTRHPILGWPFLRGPVNFIDSMIHGVKALLFSAEFYPDDEEEEPKKEKKKKGKKGEETAKIAPEATESAAKAEEIVPEAAEAPQASLEGEKVGESAENAPQEEKTKEKSSGAADAAMGAAVTLALVFGLGISILLFFVLPTLITGFLTPYVTSRLLLSLIEGGVRMVIFLLYIILTAQVKDMKRVYRYHGAEHKTIFCYERGLPLTVENVRDMPRHHPRCGTSFLFVVMCVAILIHAALGIGWDNTWIRLAVRLLSLPIIVSITYEINRFVGRHDNWLTRILTAPGLWLQNFTTREPDDTMIEVGIRALSEVLPEEQGADKW